MKLKKRKHIGVLVVCLVIVYAVAFVGSLFTSPATSSDWYDSIRPSITPPNWVFPVVWNVLFFLIGLSLYFAWINGEKARSRIALVFGINFVLNILWSVLYFGMRRLDLAFYEIFVLIISIILMIYVAGKVDKKAGWLLVPYLLWVSFASVLNYLSAF